MAGTATISIQQIVPISRSLPTILKNTRYAPHLLPRSPVRPRNDVKRSLVVFAAEGNGIEKDPNEIGNDSNGREDLKRDGRPLSNLRWRDLLDPDPENILAVGLTGLLTWASVQVLWQLFFISIAILVAALKYSFIAALLLIILLTLL